MSKLACELEMVARFEAAKQGHISVEKAARETVDSIIKTCGVFFAFGRNQLAEYLAAHPKLNKDDLCGIGAGGIAPNKAQGGNYFDLLHQMSKLEVAAHKARQEQDPNYFNKLIEHHLANTEAYYTGEIEDAKDCIDPDLGITDDMIWNVYRNTSHKYDW